MTDQERALQHYARALKHYKTKANMAKKLGKDRQVIDNWSKRGTSKAGQLEIEMSTNGKVKRAK